MCIAAEHEENRPCCVHNIDTSIYRAVLREIRKGVFEGQLSSVIDRSVKPCDPSSCMGI